VARLTNAHIRSFAQEQSEDAAADWEFFCECGCGILVAMTIAEYDEIDGVWADGHRSAAVS
jgi:hypothetical protein